MMKTVAFNHELLYERLPAGHVTRLHRKGEYCRQWEQWAQRQRLRGRALEAVERLLRPSFLYAGLN